MDDSQYNSMSVLVARIFSLVLGPTILLLMAIRSVLEGTGWNTPADYAYFLILAGVVACRWVDYRWGDPQTSTGQSATWSHFRRFAVVAVFFGIAIWIIANAIGNSGLPVATQA
jgi:hypothetical protein